MRFLPEYDNVLLSHADRSRFGADGDRRFATAAGPYKGAVLVDGQVEAIWHSEHERQAERSTVVVEHLRLPRRALTAVEAEARRMARFWHGAAAVRDVRLVPVA